MSFGSNVRPSIFGCLTVGSWVLLICRFRMVEYSAGSGVNRVVVVLSALRVSWFFWVHWCICSRYCCTWCCAVSGLVWEERMVMSSA